MPTNDELLKERIKARRRALGFAISFRRTSARLTQEHVALVLGWSRTTLVAIEAGKQATTIDQLYSLADMLDYDITDFLQYDLSIEATKVNGYGLPDFSRQMPRRMRKPPAIAVSPTTSTPSSSTTRPATSPTTTTMNFKQAEEILKGIKKKKKRPTRRPL